MPIKYVTIPEEWATFQENARRFDDNPPDKRYGILDPSAKPPLTDASMLWASDPRTLHNKHYENWPPIALRIHLERLEVMEGKR